MSYDILKFDYTKGLLASQMPRPVDLVFADPPYNIGVKYDSDPTKDRLPRENYIKLIEQAVDQLRLVSRVGATLWWVCPASDCNSIESILERFYGPQVYKIVWHETFSQYNRHDLTQDYRFILCHARFAETRTGDALKAVTKNLDAIRVPSKRMEMGDKRAAGPRIPGRVWQFRRLQGTSKDRISWHPAQMPPELLQRIVKGWSNPRDHVLDAFAGSGSLGVECLKLDRYFTGVDRSALYCRNMRNRLRKTEKELNVGKRNKPKK